MTELVECPLYEEVDLSDIKQSLPVTVVHPASTPMTLQPQLPPGVTVVQSDAASPLIQPPLQPGIAVVQPDDASVVIQPHLQPAAAVMVQSEAQPAVTVVQPAPVSAVFQPVVHQTQAVVTQPNLRDIPAKFICSYCHMDIVTVTRYLADPTVSCSLFGSTCTFNVWPCCLVPFRSCTDVEHSCPNCHNILYVFKRHS